MSACQVFGPARALRNSSNSRVDSRLGISNLKWKARRSKEILDPSGISNVPNLHILWILIASPSQKKQTKNLPELFQMAKDPKTTAFLLLSKPAPSMAKDPSMALKMLTCRSRTSGRCAPGPNKL